MNCPGTPGQNSIGRKAQSVVAVEEMIGQNIRLAAAAYARIGPTPRSTSLSAYSTTTIAPSTSIPTARIRPNITMLEIEIPKTASSAKHKRNEVGIAKPTNKDGRIPSEASTTIITSAIAVSTEASSWLTMPSTFLELSIEKETLMAARKSSGQRATSASTASFAAATVAIRFAPLDLTTCKATVVSPL